LKIGHVAGLVDESLHAVNPTVVDLGENGTKIVNKLTDDLAIMKTDMDKPRSSPLTKPIMKVNLMCDKIFGDIKRSAKAGEMSASPGRAAEGEVIVRFLKPFWNLDREPLMTQITMMKELNTRYLNNQPLQNAAIKLGINDLFPELAGQNMILDNLYHQRLNEDAELTPAATKQRANVEFGYDNLCTLVAQTVNLEPVAAPVMTAFAEMDNIRKKYAAILPSRIDIKHATVMDIPPQAFTENPVTPIPTVYYEGKLLVFAADFIPSYRNNIKVGEATVILHGKGRFTGRHERSFNIKELK
jgi:hypothetical protein